MSNINISNSVRVNVQARGNARDYFSEAGGGGDRYDDEFSERGFYEDDALPPSRTNVQVTNSLEVHHGAGGYPYSRSPVQGGAGMLGAPAHASNYYGTGDQTSKAKVDIVLDHTIAVAGGLVTGFVEVKADETLSMVECLVSLIGTESIPKELKKERVVISLHDVLSRQRVVQSGKTNFPFKFALPDNLPSSFQSTHAEMTYRVQGCAKFTSGQAEAATVVRIAENCANAYNQHLRAPATVSANGSKSFFMAGSGEMNTTASLSRGFYRTGEPIVVQLKIENATKKRMPFVKIQLVRLLTIGDAPDLEKVVDSESFGDKTVFVDPNETRTIILHMESIPPFTWTVLQTQLFKVNYAVHVTLEVGTIVNKPLKLVLPIRIAHPISCQPSLIPSVVDPAGASVANSFASSGTGTLRGNVPSVYVSEKEIPPEYAAAALGAPIPGYYQHDGPSGAPDFPHSDFDSASAPRESMVMGTSSSLQMPGRVPPSAPKY